jgi:hypothetical protein
MTATIHHPERTGERVELARYTIGDQYRIIYGQRVGGVVRLTDNPASGRGRAFLIERELEQDGNAALQALLADYLEQAAKHDKIPMRRSTCYGGRPREESRPRVRAKHDRNPVRRGSRPNMNAGPDGRHCRSEAVLIGYCLTATAWPWPGRLFSKAVVALSPVVAARTGQDRGPRSTCATSVRGSRDVRLRASVVPR